MWRRQELAQAPSVERDLPVGGTLDQPLQRVRRTGPLAWLWLRAAAALLWLVLATWRLDSVPGMSLDEAWTILSARGEWPPDNPLSGMTSYAGPFPVLLLRLFGTAHGLWVLRGACVLANAVTLLLIVRMLRRLYPARVLEGWALPMLATCPALLVLVRTGVEVVMFTPLAFASGLYGLLLGTPRAVFAAGLAWGLLVYNHPVGACFPIGFGLAWLVVFRRRPPVPLAPLLWGGLLGIAPRLLAIALYHGNGLVGPASSYSLSAALGDLRWLPGALWRAWHGEVVYLRYVGHLAVAVWPYGLLGLPLIALWVTRPRAVPRHAWFMLLAFAASSALVTLAAPYMAVRFFVVPVLALTAFLVLLGAAAIERAALWRWPVRAAALALTACNLFYVVADFMVPWQRGTLTLTTFPLGERAANTNTWTYLPKERLAGALSALEPPPQQVLTVPSLERSLRVLLEPGPIRVRLPGAAEAGLRSVFVDYEIGQSKEPYCVPVAWGSDCFSDPVPISEWYRIYR
jgi:hypothetical protein